MAHLKINQDIMVNSTVGEVYMNGVTLCLKNLIWNSNSSVVKISYKAFENETVADTQAVPLSKVFSNNQTFIVNKNEVIKRILPLLQDKLKTEQGLTDIEDLVLKNTDWHELTENGDVIDSYIQNIRVFITYEAISDMCANPIDKAMVDYIHDNNIYFVKDVHGMWLYLSTLLPEHEALLLKYNAVIQDAI